ncbi:hypothetical protein [Weissella confusa]|uniref:hypothetical protein n=1 Tax=Weissella confusa TaxID=1583 RepID=UPI0022E79F45|nr:hypothetical protein [Weissella confusa]
MNKNMDLFFISGLVIKKWYLTLLLPVIIAAGTFYFVNKQNVKEAKYEAVSSFVVANKNAVKEDTVANFEYSDMLISSLAELVTNNKVIKNALHELDGKEAHTDNQIQYILAPEIKRDVTVLVKESIVQVSYRDKSATRAKKMVNELVSQTKTQEHDLWDTKSIKVLDKATTPLKKNVNLRKTLMFTAVAFFVPFVIIAALVLALNNRKPI